MGIGHDIAKEMNWEDSIKYAEENEIEMDEIEKRDRSLIHGKVGADICKKRYGFTEEMVQAIVDHTTGNVSMTMLGKILFVADKTEEGRKFPRYDIAYERQLANTNINQALIYIIDENMRILIEDGKIIHPKSILARNYLLMAENRTKNQ